MSLLCNDEQTIHPLHTYSWGDKGYSLIDNKDILLELEIRTIE